MEVKGWIQNIDSIDPYDSIKIIGFVRENYDLPPGPTSNELLVVADRFKLQIALQMGKCVPY